MRAICSGETLPTVCDALKISFMSSFLIFRLGLLLGVTFELFDDVLIPEARTASSKVIPETSGHGGGGVIPISSSSSTVEFSMLLVWYSSLLGAVYMVTECL